MVKDAIEAIQGNIIVTNGEENFLFKIQIPYHIEEFNKIA